MATKYEKQRAQKGTEGRSNKQRLIGLGIIDIICLFIMIPVITFLTNLIGKIIWVGSPDVSGQTSENRFFQILNDYKTNDNAAQNWQALMSKPLLAFQQHPKIFLLLLVISMGLITFLLARMYLRNRNTNENQYGHSRLASMNEIKKQYQSIPKQDKEFAGIGGIPIAANRRQYYIDTNTTNNLIIGKTRSGKGEGFIFPMIDILSRAQEKSSMVINDPKQELYRGSYKTLRKRGYQVKQINLLDPSVSAHYNPLDNVIHLAKLGYYDEVQQEINNLTTSIYDDPKSQNKYWDNSSINLMNSMILALLDRASEKNDYSFINMYTAVSMLTRLGGQNEEQKDKKGRVIEVKNKLILYFEALAALPKAPFREMAIDAFQQSKFAGDETAGNIYSSAMERVKIYQQINIAKLTAKSDFSLRNLGFPRRFTIKFSAKEYHHEVAVVNFSDKEDPNFENPLESKTINIDQNGVLEFPIKTKLPNSFLIQIKIGHKGHEVVYKGNKIFARNSDLSIKKDDFDNRPIIENIKLKVKQVVDGNGKHVAKKNIIGEVTYKQLEYSERPTAVFLITPIDNPSYNQIAAFFIDQEFNVSNKLAIKAGGKTYTRIHNIIDEAANLPTIANLEKKITLSLGMNIVWTLVIQSLEQLEINYSEKQAKTIQDNCGNKIYLLTDSSKTAKEFSERLGQRTVQVNTMQTNTLRMSSTGNQSFIAQNLLDANDLLNLQNGECVILRSSKRFDLNNKKIIPYAIFNEGRNAMPMRYQLRKMSKEFNPDTPITSINQYMNFQELSVDDITISDWNSVYKEVKGEAFETALNNSIPKTVSRERKTELSSIQEQDLKASIKTALQTKFLKTIALDSLQQIAKELDSLSLVHLVDNIQGTELSQHPEVIEFINKKIAQQGKISTQERGRIND